MAPLGVAAPRTRTPRRTGPAQKRENDVSSTTEYDRAIAALVALPDDELAEFVRKLDAALREARLGMAGGDLDDATTIAASARILLRGRRAAVAGDRAKAIVGELLGAEDE